MASDIDIVRTGYESFCRGDVQTMRAMFAEDIEWRDAGPAGGACSGRDAVLRRAFAPVAESHDELSAQVLEYSARGGTVIVTGAFRLASGDGAWSCLPFVHVCTVRGGRISSLSASAPDAA
jgi:ketosteroid isomerase-like protein